MFPKVLTMITGDEIIAILSEMKDEQDNPICFLITHPYKITLIPSSQVDEQGNPISFNVNYTKWMASSSDYEFRIPFSSVMAIGEPEAQIMQTYKSKFGELFNDDDTVSTSDSNDSSEESGVSDSGD